MAFISIDAVIRAIASHVEVHAGQVSAALRLDSIPDKTTVLGMEIDPFSPLNRKAYTDVLEWHCQRSRAAALLDAVLDTASKRGDGPTWYDVRETGIPKISESAHAAYLPLLVDLSKHAEQLFTAYRTGKLDLILQRKCKWDQLEKSATEGVGFHHLEINQLLDTAGIPHSPIAITEGISSVQEDDQSGNVTADVDTADAAPDHIPDPATMDASNGPTEVELSPQPIERELLPDAPTVTNESSESMELQLSLVPITETSSTAGEVTSSGTDERQAHDAGESPNTQQEAHKNSAQSLSEITTIPSHIHSSRRADSKFDELVQQHIDCATQQATHLTVREKRRYVRATAWNTLWALASSGQSNIAIRATKDKGIEYVKGDGTTHLNYAAFSKRILRQFPDSRLIKTDKKITSGDLTHVDQS